MIHVQYMRIYLLVYDCPYTIYSELNLSFFNVRNNFFQILVNVLLTLQVCSLDYKKGFVITLDLVL